MGGTEITGTFTGLPEGATTVAGGITYSISYLGGTSGHDVVLTAMRSVTAVGVNGGMQQRSLVTSIAVTFNVPTTLTSGAFTLIRQSDYAAITDGGPSPQITVSTTDNTTYVLKFSGSAGTVQNGSLADGVWVLNINHAMVPGMLADYTTPSSTAAGAIHRLFGDINGDAIVDGTDFAAFANALGSSASNSNYVRAFDLTNGNNGTNSGDVIDTTDYTAFVNNYGLSM